MTNGILIIISAPSGTGKTTILQKVMGRVEKLVFSVSHTTRPPRTGEENGRDYFFIGRQKFEEMIAAGDFLEWAQVHDNYYGTARPPLQEQLAAGNDVVLDIDVQGAGIIRASEPLPAVHIFIAPPNIEELEKRLRGRNTEDENAILKRLSNARKEMGEANSYDYMIVNERLEDAVEMLCGIIYAERARARRYLNGQPIAIATT